nr:MAG TPA: hypothetical protein [Caudoviricetes sp.]
MTCSIGSFYPIPSIAKRPAGWPWLDAVAQ